MTPSPLYSMIEESTETPESRNEALVHLVRARNFGAAEFLRVQLIKDGITIEPHPIYEQAALANLQWPHAEQRQLRFETWFFLVPPNNSVKRYHRLFEMDANPFPDARRILFHTGSPSNRLHIILRFGLICASKGYFQPMLRETLPLIIRFASPDVGSTWLLQMERAIAHDQPKEGGDNAINYFRRLQIKICCQAGWLSHAMDILNSNPQFHLSYKIRTILADSLKEAGQMDDLLILQQRPNTAHTQRPRPLSS